MKKSIFIFFLIMTVFAEKSYAISAKSAVVIDGETPRVLFEKNAYEKLPMASTTKIMTGLLACESGKMNDTVTVSPRASGTEGSSLWLEPGEKQTLENLTYGLMLRSGNDAAVAIAEFLAGNTDAFALLMNKRAKELGAKSTSFRNPNGLDAENHYTTAYDLALIAGAAMKNKAFARIAATKEKKIPWESSQYDRVIKNHNKMLWRYDGCKGVKTGFTKKCGRCLVTYAERNNVKLIAVTLNAPDDWNDHTKMLDGCFAKCKSKVIFTKGQAVEKYVYDKKSNKSVNLTAKKGFSATVCSNDTITQKKEYLPLKLPAEKGTTIAKVHIFCNNSEIGTTELVCDKRIKKPSVAEKIKFRIKNFHRAGVHKLAVLPRRP